MTDNREDLIIAWLQDRLSPEEQRSFESWRNESEENRKMVDHFRHVWQLTGNREAARDFQSDEEWKKLVAYLPAVKEVPITTLQEPVNFWLKVAASILIVFLSSGIVYLTVMQAGEITVQTYANTSHAVLPDGSEAWLNRGSRLIYENNFDKSRSVKLVGEAYFDIKRDPDRPFVVNTPDAQVKVLGTSFNVKAYAYETETEVFVVTGKVIVAIRDQQVTLTPGNTGILDKNNRRLTTFNAEDQNSLAWKNKQLVFKKTPLSKVMKILRVYFRKEIEVSNEKLLHCRFTGSFNDPTIEEVIETLGLALNLKVNRKQGAYLLDGPGCEAL